MHVFICIIINIIVNNLNLSVRTIQFFGFEAHMRKTSLEKPPSRSALLANTTLIINNIKINKTDIFS